MMNELYNIKTIHELRHAIRVSQQNMERMKNRFNNNKETFINGVSPSKIFTSFLDSMVSAISDMSLIHKGYSLAMSFIDSLFPDKTTEQENDVADTSQNAN